MRGRDSRGSTPQNTEAGFIETPSKSARPHRRDAREWAGTLQYVNPCMQVHNFGTAANKAPTSASVTNPLSMRGGTKKRDTDTGRQPAVNRLHGGQIFDPSKGA